MSPRWSTARPRTCSGAMYPNVPSTVPGVVSASCVGSSEPSARGVAVSNFRQYLVRARWSSLTFDIDGKEVELELRPDVEYPQQLRDIMDVGIFIEAIKERMA